MTAVLSDSVSASPHPVHPVGSLAARPALRSKERVHGFASPPRDGFAVSGLNVRGLVLVTGPLGPAQRHERPLEQGCVTSRASSGGMPFIITVMRVDHLGNLTALSHDARARGPWVAPEPAR